MRAEHEDTLIVVNSTLPTHFPRFWNGAKTKLCADGGSNRLFDFWNAFPDPEARRSTHTPNLIKGDLDSVRPEVLHYYRVHGAKVVEDRDQDSTDLQKCLNETTVEQRTLIVGGGGNFSQEIANVNTLFSNSQRHLLLLSDENLMFLLFPGDHVIRCQEAVKVGLIPIGAKCRAVTTSGLKWNLAGGELCFGGLVSTSNEMMLPEAHVQVTDPVLWTVDFGDFMRKHNLPPSFS
jgi:thiamine pyrophosphokinase